MSTVDNTEQGAAFLSALADLLLEEVAVLEHVSDGVSDLMSSRECNAHELVVSIQGFDRVKQEFSAIGHALRRYSQSMSGSPLCTQVQNAIVADITVANLRNRFLDLLRSSHGPDSERDDIWHENAEGEEAVF